LKTPHVANLASNASAIVHIASIPSRVQGCG
jgi:hypothetical protein